MQSDTFLPDTDSSDEHWESSDDSEDLPKNNNIGVKYEFDRKGIKDERFLDQSSQEQYLRVRNELFTPSIRKLRILHYTLVGSPSNYDNIIDLESHTKGVLDNVIGFELVKAQILNARIDGSFEPFVDLHIPEIPAIACKSTPYGKGIIERLHLNADETTWYLNEPQRTYTNYFSPIKLSKLTIELYKKESLITDDKYYAHYEFEVTLLNQNNAS